MQTDRIIHGDSLNELKALDSESVDLVCTDPPYGYSFMGKSWDKTLPDIGIFKECLRVLKPGAFAFVMSAPRSDVCARMMLMLEEAGFEIGFTPIYWTYASGFPKALSVAKNIGKIADEVCELFTNASTAIQSSSDTLASTKAGVRIAVQDVEVSPKQLSFSVLVEFPSASPEASTSKQISITVPATALIEECERTLCKIKGGVPSKTELGNPKYWKQVDFDALCAELIDGWKHIIFSKLETDPTFATKCQTECVSATTVTITASTTEHLISSTAGTLAKKLGGAREIVGRSNRAIAANPTATDYNGTSTFAETAEQREASKWLTRGEHQLEGSYGGFQPKPAVEVIIVAMKPLSEKTYVDQALKNGKGITWLDDCRVPTESDTRRNARGGDNGLDGTQTFKIRERRAEDQIDHGGRFPANLIISDDVLNDHSRFFSVDEWAKTIPFLIVPKAAKSEKNKGCENRNPQLRAGVDKMMGDPQMKTGSGNERSRLHLNNHPTVKPLKLMSYLITLGSRPGDTVLDPFLGSGTTAIAAKQLRRKYIGIEREQEYVTIAEARIGAIVPTLL